MELDEISPANDALLGWFDLSEAAFPWTDEVVDNLVARREQMDGKLFIDVLLPNALDAHGSPLYPPTDAQGFAQLLVAIQQSNFTIMQKESIGLYFLCHWYPQSVANPNGFAEDGTSFALSEAKLQKFARARNIAPHYASIVRAYFLLDHAAYEPAIRLLCDPRILPDWSSKVLSTLAAAGLDQTSTLILRYVRCVKPKLLDFEQDIKIYMSCLVRHDFMGAWSYQRSFPHGPYREQCIQYIIEMCLIPEHRPDALKQLVAFPFDKTEEDLIMAYASMSEDKRPPELSLRSLAVLRQLLLVRLVQSGRYTEALRLDRALPVPDGDETRIRERRALMRHVLGLVPPIQRPEVEREYNGSTRTASTSGSWTSVNSDLSSHNMAASMSSSMGMSWEDLSSSRNQPKAAPPMAASSSGVRRPSFSRLEGPAAATLGTPTKRFNQSVNSPMRGERGRQQPGTPISAGGTPRAGQSIRPMVGPNLPRGFVQPVYNPAPAQAFSPLLKPSGTVTPSKRPLPESPVIVPVQDNDVDMVHSDDPDGFVVRPQVSAVPRLARTRGGRANVVNRSSPDGTIADSSTFPGAFPDHEHEEEETTTARKSKRQRQGEDFEMAPPAVVTQKKPPTTRVRGKQQPDPHPPAPRGKARTAATPVARRRGVPTRTRTRRESMPGELPMEGDGDSTHSSNSSESSSSDEEDDDVPDLPPPTQPARRGGGRRSSRASSSEPDSTAPIRRSSRLSHAPVAEPAPQPAASAKKSGPTTRRRSAEPPAAGSSRMATRRTTVRRPNVTLEEMDE